MATFEKRPNGSWRAKVYAGRDANGKVLYKSITKPSLKECKKAARELEQEIADNRFIDIGRTRLITWCEKWLELNEARLSPTTFLSYEVYVRVHYKPFFKNLRLDKVNEIHIRDFMNSQLKKGLSPTTVRKHMLVLSEILEDALKHKNPCRGIKLPEPEEYLPHVITDEEFQAIRTAMASTREGLRDEIIVLLAGWCGLRRGEIFALKWNDIDYQGKYIRIDESRALGKNGYIEKAPKSKKSIRLVAVPQELLDKIREYQKKSVAKKFSRLLFPTRPDNFSRHFSRVLKRNGLPDVRFHDLRHYHASWMYHQGVPDHYAAKRLGHDIQVLKGIYQHLNLSWEEALDEAVRQGVPGILESENGRQNGRQKG